MKGTMMKFRLEEKVDAQGTLVLYLYDEVTPDGYDWWTGKTTQSETSASYFRDRLAEHANVQTIEVRINSVGGSVIEGYGIYAQLKTHPARKVVYVDGFACSIASVIALAGDEIIMYRNSMMCIHNMADWCHGNAAAHRKCADDLDKIMEGNRQIYLGRGNDTLTEERLVELLEAETWLTAKECKALGWCTEIVDEDADLSGIEPVLEQRKAGLVAQLSSMRALSQMVRDMAQASQQAPDPDPEPESPPATEPKQDQAETSKTQRLFAAILR